jgi:hypothetical protein
VSLRDSRGFPGERHTAGQALEGHHAERVQVGAGREGRPGSRRAGVSEIGDLQLPAAPADQQAGGLYVTVHQAGRVGGLQGPGGLRDQADGPRGL